MDMTNQNGIIAPDGTPNDLLEQNDKTNILKQTSESLKFGGDFMDKLCDNEPEMLVVH